MNAGMAASVFASVLRCYKLYWLYTKSDICPLPISYPPLCCGAVEHPGLDAAYKYKVFTDTGNGCI